MPKSEVFCMDCLEAMRKMPDNAYDLAVVDPPYGAGFTEGGGCQGWFAKYHQTSDDSPDTHTHTAPSYNRFGSKDSWFERYKRYPDGGNLGGEVRKKIIAWDVAPGQEYFDELFRVSRNQVIWGGNYFDLPPNRCFLVWRKLSISENFTMAMAEYAWTSFNSNAKVFECAPQGRPDDPRFHPTAKPIELYEWIYKHYAKPGDKILDTHMGSQASRIAAWNMGFDYTGYEIDPEYFKKGCERFERQTAQMNLFLEGI